MAQNDDLPDDIRDRLASGHESPIKILRKHRGMTQEQLAAAAQLSRPYLTEIEQGRKEGSLKVMKAIASALDVDLGHVVPAS
jgi:transcriptional regulator with XRE-family HTH domain